MKLGADYFSRYRQVRLDIQIPVVSEDDQFEKYLAQSRDAYAISVKYFACGGLSCGPTPSSAFQLETARKTLLEILLPDDLRVMKFMAGDNPGHTPDCNRVVTGCSAERPSLVGEVREKIKGGDADMIKFFGEVFDRTSGKISVFDEQILVE